MRNSAIGLIARYPENGKVKTRLARTVGDAVALEVYRWLLARTDSMLASLPEETFLKVAFVTPSEELEHFSSAYGSPAMVEAQVGVDLGQRMQNAFDLLLSQPGIDRAMLIAADCPELDSDMVSKAGTLLSNHDLVLGPASDGGYYLIGQKENHPPLFRGIHYGGSTVLEETVAVAQTLKLEVHCLEERRDLDDEQDWEYFKQSGLL